MEIRKVTENEFKKYGKVLKNYDCNEIIERMEFTPLTKDVVYEPSIKGLEELKIAKEFREREFGGLLIQIGYCNGNNHALNALEYHRSSEVNVAVTDLILLLGCESDIEDDYTYDTSKVEAFFVPQGTAIELYATTLHYAPCNANVSGFKCVVILPRGTNSELENKIEKCAEDKLLFAKNKWLIAHKESGLESEGAFLGLKGDNVTL